MMQITRGKIATGTKFAVYGSEGIGKSTFVSQIPGVVFIDTEGSTNNMDVQRLPTPKSWAQLLAEVDDALRNSDQLNALVIDTADWAERLLLDEILTEKQLKSIADIPYGGGWELLKDRFGKLLDKLSELSAKGVHVGFTAHAQMRKFEQPDELGAYDRWEMKTSKKVAPLIKEWCDILLFANYKTVVYATDDKGKKHKAAGGQRVMYTTHHPCWDAKNRHGLADELPFDFQQVAQIFQPIQHQATTPEAPKPQVSVTFTPPASTESVQRALKPEYTTQETPDAYRDVPKKLADLMRAAEISPIEVKAAVAQKGYFPVDTPWDKYPKDFVDGVLIGAWEQVKAMVLENRKHDPF